MSADFTDAGARRGIAIALGVAALTALLAAAAPLPGRVWLFGAGAFAMPGLLIALGARRGGRGAVAAWLLLLLVEGAGLGLLAAGGDRSIGGLPLAAWLLLGGLGLVPLLVAPALFAADFERFAPDGETLRRLRATRDAAREDAGR